MRITEQQLEAIQNKRNIAQKGTLQRDKGKSDAMVAEQLNEANTSEIRAFYEDGLVKCGLCVDDEQFDELLVKRGNVIKGGLIKLKVSEV
ncbi:hypothetical protein [Acinetobacter baumannii]|uniref:hypothetical protein n=1 Tax=Acinetobacter baumannii TaxID=470 RepID=UPI003B43D37C